MMLILSSCGGNVNKILNTVPKESAIVMAADLSSINSKLQADGQTLPELISSTMGSEFNDEGRFFLGEDSPLDFDSPLVAFDLNHNDMVVTFYVKDEGAFREAVSERGNINLREKDGIWFDDEYSRMVMIGKQVWIGNSYRGLDPREIKALSVQDAGKSIMAHEAAKEVLGGGSDVAILANTSSMGRLDREMGRQLAMLEMVFDDPAFFGFEVNFEKGKAVAHGSVLDKKGKPSKMAYKLAKIDTGKLKDFKGKGAIFFASAIDPATVSQALDKMKGFNFPPDMTRVIKAINGNVAVSYNMDSDNPYGDGTFSATVGFSDSQAANSFVEMLREMSDGEIAAKVSGDNVLFGFGNPTGVTVSEVANEFDGAVAGCAVITRELNYRGAALISDMVPSAHAVVKPKGDGIELEIVVNTTEGKNSLTTLFKLARIANANMGF